MVGMVEELLSRFERAPEQGVPPMPTKVQAQAPRDNGEADYDWWDGLVSGVFVLLGIRSVGLQAKFIGHTVRASPKD
jgi:hypothetical protein